ncbi:MAG TPA: cell division protein FtsQ/DivIB [Gemmatimonadota bacterium]|jgi:cell division septal protein FtsQ
MTPPRAIPVRRPAARTWAAPRARAAANRRRHPALERSRRRRATLALIVPLGALAVFLAFRIAFQEGFFRVREITFHGLVHARPAVLVAEAGLARPRSMFDDFAFVVANLSRDPLIREVRVRRELPARLVVEVRERSPAAYWGADSGVVAIDAEGRVLPLDPARYGWDLPVLVAPWDTAGGTPGVQAGRLVDGDARALLRLVIGIRDRVPEVSRRISTAELERGDRVVLHLMGEGGEVRLRLETPIDKVALLPDVLRDLKLKRQGFASLDLSFQDQIVVRPVDLAPEASGADSAGNVVASPGARDAETEAAQATGSTPAVDLPAGARPQRPAVPAAGLPEGGAARPPAPDPARSPVPTSRDPVVPGPAAGLPAGRPAVVRAAFAGPREPFHPDRSA